jgi:glycosyltransferase involved in cell wall biosynthesis
MVMRSKPKFSIIIPAYNEASFISLCLESLDKQITKTSYEVIVIDNASTDATAELAKKAGARVVHEPKKGVCAARQAGLLAARGDIIISTDADTQFDKNWLNRIEMVFYTNSEVVAVAGPVSFNNAPIWGKIYPKLLFGATHLSYLLFGSPFYISACNFAYKRSSFDGYNVLLKQGGDELYVLKNLKKKGRVYFDPKNTTYTSSRRLAKGFVYNVFVTIGAYYFLDYNLSKIFKRSIFGSYPAFRKEPKSTINFTSTTSFIVLAIILLSLTSSGHVAFAHIGHTLFKKIPKP